MENWVQIVIGILAFLGFIGFVTTEDTTITYLSDVWQRLGNNIYYDDGNVSVNNTLEVGQDTYIDGDLYLAGEILTVTGQNISGNISYAQDNRYYIGSPSKSPKIIYTNNLTAKGKTTLRNTSISNTTTLAYATTGARVGIGTQSPLTRLDVFGTTSGQHPASGTTTSTVDLRLNRGDAGINVIDFGIDGSSPFSGWVQVTAKTDFSSNYPLSLNPNGGNVGIGTYKPQYALDVGNNSLASNFILRVSGRRTAGIILSSDVNNDPAEIYTPYVYMQQDGTSTEAVTGLVQSPNLDPRASTFTGSLSNAYIMRANNALQFGSGTSVGITLDTLNRLGIGTTTPLTKFNLVGQAGNETDLPYIDRYTGSNGPAVSAIITRKARGTLTAPTAIKLDDGIGGFGARGYGATGFSSGSRAYFYTYAGENWTDSVQGTYMAFGTTPIGSTTVAEKMRLTGAGYLGIGTTTPYQTLDVRGRGVFNTTEPQVYINSPSATGNPEIIYSNNDGNKFSTYVSDSGAYWAVYSYIAGSTGNKLMVKSTGNIGVATANPNQTLDVSGTTILRQGTQARETNVTNITISGAGSLRLTGTGTVFNDIVVPFLSVKLSGLRDPSFSVLRDGVYAYAFDDLTTPNEQQAFLSLQLPHTWKEGTALGCHLHYTTPVNYTGNQNATWGLEYTKAKLNTKFPVTTTIYASEKVNNTAFIHSIVPFTNITMTGNTLSTVMDLRIFRRSGSTGDNYTSSVYALSFDCHYEIDKLGSENEYTN